MNDTDIEICYLSAFDTLNKYKENKLSPVDVISAVIKRIEIINPKILILGKEFQKTNDKKIVEVINFLKDRDVKTIFHAGEIVYSNSFLLQDSESDLIKKQRDKFIAVCKKQELNCQKLVNQIFISK